MKKLLATILALMMALGVTTMAWAEGEWTGSGTEADPYMITTEAGLNKLATDVNSGTVYSGKYFKLGASINVTNWTPIGQKGSDNKFAGTFDGNGQTVTINGIKSDLDPSFDGYAGFFGATNGATIKNLTVDGTISGADVAGIVARMDGGTVENCVNKATVTGNRKAAGIVVITKGSGEATIQNCRNYGTIKSTGDRAGGIVNLVQIATEVLNCKNYGAVTSEATGTYAAGGIVGWVDLEQSGAQFKIDGCENTAAVSGKGAAGGILGGASGSVGTVSSCINSGTVTLSGTAGTSNEHANIGGVVGQGHTDMEGLAATGNTSTGALAGSYTRRTIAEDVTLADQSYSQLYICKGAKVEITAGKIENYLTNYGTLTIKGAQIGESGEGGVNAQFQNYGTATLNCVMKAGSIHSQQGAATVFNGGEYHFTCAEEMRNGLQFVAGKFIDLRSGSGNVQWDDNTFRSYVAEGATVAYDETAKTWTVSMPVSGVALDKTSAELQVGKTLTLTATVTPDNATDKAVAWTSSNDAVATVDANGVVTAKAEGTATITATAGGKTATCTVTVKAAPRYYYNSTTTTGTKADGTKGSPKTFDAGVGIYAVTAVLSVTGMAWTAKKREN